MARVFVSFAADNAEALQLKLSLANDVAGLRTLTERVASGSELWGDWARSHGGQQVTRDFLTGRVEVPAEHLGDIPKLREAYQDRAGLSCSVGIGRLPADADNALQFAKLHGGDKAVFWREEYREELARAKAKEAQEGLNKAEGGVEPQPQKTGKQPEKVAEKAKLADRFHAVAKKAAQGKSVEKATDSKPAPNDDSRPDSDAGGQDDRGDDALRARLVQVLLQVKEQAPLLEKIKQTNPKLYEAIAGSIQAMLVMAKQLNEGPDDEGIQKSEGFKPKPCTCSAYPFPHRYGGGNCKGEINKDELPPGVYRVQDGDGLGPYRVGAGDSKALQEAIDRLRDMPPPTRDFDPMKFGRHPLLHKFVYGFPSLQVASQFLGGGLLDRLTREGYQLRRYTPKGPFFVGRSGKQVAFLRDNGDMGEPVDLSHPDVASLFKSEGNAVYVLWHPQRGYLDWHGPQGSQKIEQDPAEGAPPQGGELDKAAMPEHRLGTLHTDVMPVGTKKDGPAAGQGHRDAGQIKIEPNAYDGVPPEQQRARYVQVRAGMIRSNKLGTPISSRSVNR
jgi:hypothetical protein